MDELNYNELTEEQKETISEKNTLHHIPGVIKDIPVDIQRSVLENDWGNFGHIANPHIDIQNELIDSIIDKKDFSIQMLYLEKKLDEEVIERFNKAKDEYIDWVNDVSEDEIVDEIDKHLQFIEKPSLGLQRKLLDKSVKYIFSLKSIDKEIQNEFVDDAINSIKENNIKSALFIDQIKDKLTDENVIDKLNNIDQEIQLSFIKFIINEERFSYKLPSFINDEKALKRYKLNRAMYCMMS